MKNKDTKKYIIGAIALGALLSIHPVMADNDDYEKYEKRENHRYEEREDRHERYKEREEYKYGKQERGEDREMKEHQERKMYRYGKDGERGEEKRKHEFEKEMKGKNFHEEKEKHTVDFSGYIVGELTEAEKEAIIHMREEEKMARDVYRTLSKTTNSKAFINVPISEEIHMDAFAQLIERYNLIDPVQDESAIGVYTNLAFTKLFNELTEKGKKSDKDAFEVGATIEDINMANLIKYSSATEKEDLKLAYETLLSQSKHHMSAFVRNLEKLGEKYNPEHISKEELDEAVKSGKEHMQKEAREGGKKAMEMEREIEGNSYEQEKVQKETNRLVSFIQNIIKNIFSGWFK